MTPSAVDIFLAVVSLKPRLQLTLGLSKYLAGEKKKQRGSEKQKQKQTEAVVVVVDDLPDQFSLDLRFMVEALETIEPDPARISDDAERKYWNAQVTTLSTYFKQVITKIDALK